MSAVRYPLSAVLGNDDLVLALVLNAVSPAIGGVLVRGEKGTAKSTAVRALTAVLPPVSVVDGCRFSCDPAAPDPTCPDGPHLDPVTAVRPARLAELPVGATEDRLTGSLDLERALADGVRAYEPGLLAAAHRGVLYVDEVNLLHDHLVDLLLDAAALGVSYVERDGVSLAHAARFLLVGTMNPEEGELRPQLLDRFGLSVAVTAPREVSARAEVVRRRLAFDRSPAAFAARYADADTALAAGIAAAQARLEQVELTDAALEQIAAVCAAFEVDGLRADIVTARTALAHAAWAGRDAVTAADIQVAARLALPHRGRRNPFDAPGLDEQHLADVLAAHAGPDPEPPTDPTTDPGPEPDPDPDPGAESGHDPDPDDGDSAPGRAGPGPDPAAGDNPAPAAGADQTSPAEPPNRPPGAAGTTTAGSGATFATRRLEVSGLGNGAAGRRSRAVTDTGLTVRAARPVTPLRHLHLVGTVTAAAPWQRERGRQGPLVLRRGDLRTAVREGREANLVLFAVDGSGSMGARSRMGAVKGAVLSLLLDAYQRRDKVGMLAFRGQGADLLLPPTSSVDAAARRLETLPTGGRTPLTAGLQLAAQTLARERLRDPRRRPLLVVVTDGRHTSGEPPARIAAILAAQGLASVVVDCESGPVRLGMAAALADALHAEHLPLRDLAAAPLASLVRDRRAS